MNEINELLSKIESRDAVIGIIGLGYVGLPLCREFVRGGAKVLGIDVDPRKIEAIQAKKTYIEHIPDETIAEMVDSGLFSATSDLDRLNEPDAILIAVPTPLNKMREPDLSYVEGSMPIRLTQVCVFLYKLMHDELSSNSAGVSATLS